MAKPTRSKFGKALRNSAGVVSFFICIWGFYNLMAEEFAMTFGATTYSVAAIGMGCWVTWMLGRMAQDMVDGVFIPRFSLPPPEKKKDEKADP